MYHSKQKALGLMMHAFSQVMLEGSYEHCVHVCLATDAPLIFPSSRLQNKYLLNLAYGCCPCTKCRVLTIESQKIEDHDRDHFFGDRYDRQIPFKDRDLFTRSHFDFAKSIPIPF